jgi:hypothetical protein
MSCERRNLIEPPGSFTNGIRFFWIHVSSVRLENPRNMAAPCLSKTSLLRSGVFVKGAMARLRLSVLFVVMLDHDKKSRSPLTLEKSEESRGFAGYSGRLWRAARKKTSRHLEGAFLPLKM